MLDGFKSWLVDRLTPQSSVTGIPETVASGFVPDFGGRFRDTQFFNDVWGGETEPDSFGTLRDFNHFLSIDYYQLRTMSRQLFTTNMYAASIIGRIVTNVINTGLKLEADPSKLISGLEGQAHVEWTSETEEMFNLWAGDKSVDASGLHDLSTLEKVTYAEALIEGDILRVTKFDKKTGLPTIKLIPGRHVQTAMNSLDLADDGNRVMNGVEVDKTGRHVAYHVIEQADFGVEIQAKRILARGRTSNRDTASLIYNAPPPPGKTRGFPLLYRIIQPLKQIGRYASYELKAAEINAALAMWVEKGEDVPGSDPLGGAFLKSDADTPAPNDDGDKNQLPKQRVSGGTIVNELAWGEKPHSFDTKRPNVNFGIFKKAILQDIAAALEIPPEVLALIFENSFSASRQATLEFKAFVMKERDYFSKQFNKNVYNQWLMGMVLNGKLKAGGYIASIKAGDVFGTNGWQRSRFTGFIKQNVDILKEGKAYKEYVDEGFITRDQASNELTGADFATTVKRLKDENQMLADAREPLLGEINTSISKVEGKEPEQQNQKQTQQISRSQNGISISGFNDRTTNAILALLRKEQDTIEAYLENLDDPDSVDKDIDEIDIKELQEV